jgi:serine/threonine protein kinase
MDGRATPDAAVDPSVPRTAIKSMTAKYQAPELNSEMATVSSKIDVYSCGAMFGELREDLDKIGARAQWPDLGTAYYSKALFSRSQA